MMRDLKAERPQPIRILMLSPDNVELEKNLKSYFTEDKFPITLVAATNLPDRCRSLIREVFPKIVLLVDAKSQDSDWSARILQLSKDINLSHPHIATVILTDTKPDEMVTYYQAALDAGARGVVNVGRLGDGMVDNWNQIEHSIFQAYGFIRENFGTYTHEGSIQSIKAIAVTSGKGGVGKSTIATSIASEIARQNLTKRVILVDFDVQYGAIGPMLGLQQGNNIAQLAQMSISDITNIQNRNDIMNFVTPVQVGESVNLYVLAAPTSPMELSFLAPESASEILSTLRRMFDYVVIDLPSQLSDASFAAFQASELILLITEPDMLAVRANRQLIRLLEDSTLGNPSAMIRIVLNKIWGKDEKRTWGTLPVSVEDIEHIFEDLIIAQFPHDAVMVNEFISSGKAIGSQGKSSPFLRTLQKLVASFELDNADENGNKRNVLGSIGGLMKRFRN